MTDKAIVEVNDDSMIEEPVRVMDVDVEMIDAAEISQKVSFFSTQLQVTTDFIFFKQILSIITYCIRFFKKIQHNIFQEMTLAPEMSTEGVKETTSKIEDVQNNEVNIFLNKSNALYLINNDGDI